MIQIIKKKEQYNELIFGNRFYGNKPVYNGQSNVKPYSNLSYWNHGFVVDTCEFGLHPHQGFEIMTFVLKGQQEHYDTTTQVWKPLKAGDFQIMQSNSGIQHAEKINKDASAFQIWFDPNFEKSTQLKPSYKDYHAEDFIPKNINGINTITYVGDGSLAKILTPDLIIKKLILDKKTKVTLTLDENCSYTFYVMSGQGKINDVSIEQDDAVRVTGSKNLNIDMMGELFFVQTSTPIDYKPVWT